MEKRDNAIILPGRCVIVIIGNFNPAIIQPDWINRHKLMPEDETALLTATPVKKDIPEINASIEFGRFFMVSSTQAYINFNSFILKVERDRMEIVCEKRDKFPLLINFIKKIFKLLPETPVTEYGFNFDEHLRSSKSLNEISDIFFTANNSICSLFGADCKLGHIIMTQIGDAKLRFSIEPSTIYEDGIFLRNNFEYSNSSFNADFIVDKLEENFTNNLNYVQTLINSDFGEIIERKESLFFKLK